mgnify:CR=1 FL=1
MKFSIAFAFIFILSFLGFSQSLDQIQTCKDLEKVQTYFKHSNTYFWFSRHRSNSYIEFKRSLSYLDSANTILRESKCIDSTKRLKLALEIEELRKSVSNGLEISIDNLNGRYPLYMDAVNRNPELQFIDEPEEVALEKAIEELLHTQLPSSTKSISDGMYYILVVGIEDDMLYEVASQCISVNSGSYVLSKSELSETLNKSELEDFAKGKILQGSIQKILEHLSIDQLGIFHIKKRDEVQKLHYYEASFSLNDGERSSFIAMKESFVLDRTQTGPEFYTLILEILLFNFFIFLVLHLVLDRIPVWKKASIQSSSFLAHYAIDTASLLGSFLIAFAVSLAFAYFAPFEGAFFKEPSAILWRVSSFTLAPIFPLFLNFLLFSKFIKKIKVYHDINALLAIVTGSFAGLQLFYFYLYTYRFDAHPDMLFVLSFLLPSHLSSLPIALAVITLFKTNSKSKKFYKAIIRLIIGLSSISFIYYSIWLETDISNHWDNMYISFGIILASLILPELLLVYERTIKLSSKILSKLNFKSEKRRTIVSINNDEQLYKLFSDPLTTLNYYLPLEDETKFKHKVDGLLKLESDSSVLYMEGPSGSGKTALIKDHLTSLIEKDINNYGDYKLFYGDCDEFQEEKILQYEPFIQAFGEIVGDDLTKDKDSDIREKTANAISKVHQYGEVLGSILKSGENEKKSVDIPPLILSRLLIQGILDYTKYNNKKHILLVIDDIQWIDDDTLQLLKIFSAEIAKEIAKNGQLKFKLILIHTPDAEKSGAHINQESNDFEDLLKKRKELFPNFSNSTFALPKFDSEVYIENMLSLANLEFSPKSLRELTLFIENNDLNSPLLINNFLGACVRKHYLRISDKVVILKEKSDFDEISYPNAIKDQYFELFESLNPEVLNLLEAAAYIGEDFEASILADVWKIDRLKTLILLREAEKSGIIKDKNDKDDVYQFKDKKIIKHLRDYAVQHSDRLKGGTPTQLVKEYYRLIIQAYENLSEQNKKNIDPDIIYWIADRSYDYRNQLYKKAVKYNSVAFRLGLKQNDNKRSCHHFEHLINLSSSNENAMHFPFTNYLDDLIVGWGLLLDIQHDNDVLKHINLTRAKINLDELEYRQKIKVYGLYLAASSKRGEKELSWQIQYDPNTLKSVEELEMHFQYLTNQENLVAKTFNEEDVINELHKILSKLNNCKDDKAIQLAFTVRNYLGQIYLYGMNKDHTAAKECLLHNIEHITSKQVEVSSNDSLRGLEKIIEHENFIRLSLNDQHQLKMSAGPLLDILIIEGHKEEIKNCFECANELNKLLNDIYGIGLSYLRYSRAPFHEPKEKISALKAAMDFISESILYNRSHIYKYYECLSEIQKEDKDDPALKLYVRKLNKLIADKKTSIEDISNPENTKWQNEKREALRELLEKYA